MKIRKTLVSLLGLGSIILAVDSYGENLSRVYCTKAENTQKDYMGVVPEIEKSEDVTFGGYVVSINTNSPLILDSLPKGSFEIISNEEASKIRETPLDSTNIPYFPKRYMIPRK